MKKTLFLKLLSLMLFFATCIHAQVVKKTEVKYLLDSAKTYNFNSTIDSILSKTERHLYHWSGIDSIFVIANYDFINKIWINDSTTTFIDSLGRDTMRIRINNYGSSKKYTTSYNHNGLISSKAYYIWSVTHWYGVTNSVFALDSLTGDSTETVFDGNRSNVSWDNVNHKWRQPQMVYSTKYNLNGMPNRTYLSMVDEATGKLYLMFKTVYYYNNQNKDTLENGYYSINYSYFDWKHEWKAKRSYDLQGNLIQYSESSLRTNYNYWFIGNKKKWYYNNNLLMSECNLGSYDTIGITDRTTDSIYYSYNNNGQKICESYYVNDSSEIMQLVSKTYYYYSLHDVLTPVDTNDISSIEKTNQAEYISIYPNPASNKLYISSKDNESKDIVLLSSKGQEISRYRLNPGEQEITLNGIVQGFYFVKITINNQTSIHKIMIK